jgi:hypothetical protein
MVQFLSIIFFFLDFYNFCWVFQKFPFFVSPCNTSLNTSWIEKCFRQICRENQSTRLMFSNFSRDNVDKCGTARLATDDNVIWSRRGANGMPDK